MSPFSLTNGPTLRVVFRGGLLLGALLLSGCPKPGEKKRPLEPAASASASASAPPKGPLLPPEADFPILRPLTESCGKPKTETVVVELGASREMLARLFPVRPELPAPYNEAGDKSRVPTNLKASVESFVRASLVRDGFDVKRLEVDVEKGLVTIEAIGCYLEDYRAQLPRFLRAGKVGLLSWDKCAKEGVCGPNRVAHPCGEKECPPWAFYLPLGLPLVNHLSVALLDYPPADALCGADYLNNFTMNRVHKVYSRLHVEAERFEALVDVHPIAAGGTGESDAIKKASLFFTDYRKQMLEVLSTPPHLEKRQGYEGQTLPVLVLGAPAELAMSEIVGKSLKVGDAEVTDRLVVGKKTPYVVGNHPNVTSYQCCPGDTACQSPTYGNSDQLVKDELLDLNEYCWVKGAALNPLNPFNAKEECARAIASMKREVCAQARLDYSFTSEGNCHCEEAARAFCEAHEDNICPDEKAVTSCAAESAKCGKSPSWFRCEKVAPSAVPPTTVGKSPKSPSPPVPSAR